MEKQYQNKTWLEKKYLIEKLRVREIGKLCGVSHFAISCHLKKNNIPIRNASESHKGQIAWNKGLTKEADIRVALSEKTKQNISNANKGHSVWNKGVPLSQETRTKISKSTRGENGNNWKGGITSLILLIRSNYKNRQWRSDVYTRDNFTCQMCGCQEKKLNTHHIISFNTILQKHEITTLKEAQECEELWNINNGITLCEECHIKIHSKNISKERRCFKCPQE